MSVAVGPRTILLTGFRPFGGESVNPSELLVRQVDALAAPPGWTLRATVLPVDRSLYAEALAAALQLHRPELVLALGQATGRDGVQLEAVAHNLLDFRGECDNGGHAAAGEALVEGGPPQLAATLPLDRLCRQLAAEGLPVALSRDAGRHLCNALLYELLHKHPALPSAFVHVPLLPEQAARRGRGEPSLPLAESRACLEALLRHITTLPSLPPVPR